jgi:hypothetical protein
VDEIQKRLGTVATFCASTGKEAESVRQLSAPNQYWRPSTTTFPRVDSALVHDGTLFIFQATIMNKKNYSSTLLDKEFVSVVRKKVAFDRTAVFFVSPLGTGFETGNILPVPGIAFLTHEIDLTTLESIDVSLVKLFNESIVKYSKLAGTSAAAG